ncbi:MAG TPA: nucleoside/nucleotide kinase family protein [Pseudolysinimonas sp.]|nr:nucleoside/nucleotide kinase family protein [Pseudolysinimonas sp.]
MRRGLIGIAGAPGSGKSTLAERWAERLNAAAWPAVVLPMDGFHLPQARLVELGRRDRMGAPDTFDVDGFVALLHRLRDDTATVTAPVFDRTVEEAVPDALEIGAGIRTVIVEGNYLLHDADGWERVAPLLDLRLFLAEDDDERVRRLIARHIAFGKSPDDARDWALGPDRRNAELIAAGRPRADLVVAVD